MFLPVAMADSGDTRKCERISDIGVGEMAVYMGIGAILAFMVWYKGFFAKVKVWDVVMKERARVTLAREIAEGKWGQRWTEQERVNVLRMLAAGEL